MARLLATERLERLDDVRHDLVQHPEERRGWGDLYKWIDFSSNVNLHFGDSRSGCFVIQSKLTAGYQKVSKLHTTKVSSICRLYLYLLQSTMERWMYWRSRTPMARLAARIQASRMMSRWARRIRFDYI